MREFVEKMGSLTSDRNPNSEKNRAVLQGLVTVATIRQMVVHNVIEKLKLNHNVDQSELLMYVIASNDTVFSTLNEIVLDEEFGKNKTYEIKNRIVIAKQGETENPLISFDGTNIIDIDWYPDTPMINCKLESEISYDYNRKTETVKEFISALYEEMEVLQNVDMMKYYLDTYQHMEEVVEKEQNMKVN